MSALHWRLLPRVIFCWYWYPLSAHIFLSTPPLMCWLSMTHPVYLSLGHARTSMTRGKDTGRDVAWKDDLATVRGARHNLSRWEAINANAPSNKRYTWSVWRDDKREATQPACCRGGRMAASDQMCWTTKKMDNHEALRRSSSSSSSSDTTGSEKMELVSVIPSRTAFEGGSNKTRSGSPEMER